MQPRDDSGTHSLDSSTVNQSSQGCISPRPSKLQSNHICRVTSRPKTLSPYELSAEWILTTVACRNPADDAIMVPRTVERGSTDLTRPIWAGPLAQSK